MNNQMTDIPSLVESVHKAARKIISMPSGSPECILWINGPILAAEVTRLQKELETERRKVEVATYELRIGAPILAYKILTGEVALTPSEKEEV